MIAQALPLVGGLIATGIATGEFRAVDPDFSARSLMAPLIFVTLWRSVFEPIGAPPLDADAFIAHHVGLVAAGLRPQPAVPATAPPETGAAPRQTDRPAAPADGRPTPSAASPSP